MGTPVAVITPSLLLGEPEGAEHLTGVVEVGSVVDAVSVILHTGTALLPTDRWDLAVSTLIELGLSTDEVANRIRLAKTGRLE